MSGTVDSLNIKIDASARGANRQLDTLVQKMIELRSTVNGINVGNLNNLATSMQNFSKAASGLNQVKTTDFTRMAKCIEKLSQINKNELNEAAKAIGNISKAFSNMGNVSDGANKIAQLAQGISRLGYKSTTQAIQNIPLLTTELKNMMSELSKAPAVSDNIIAMTNAMANLGAQASGIRSVGSAMNSAGRSGNGFFGIMKRGISNVWKFASSVSSATNHNRSFASTIGLLYAKFWALKRATGKLGDAIKSSMDYIEEYNYFNTTMEKIASEWNKDFKQFGYESADSYGKSFEDRMTEIMNKMTGFQMNRDGTLTDSGVKNLGLDVTQMTNYAASVAQVTNSVGLTGEASLATSKALSMLAGDMSSFRNLDMSTVMNNFSSGLIGQSRALYKYGIDITNATLATYAHELGINKDISAMTQSEKMQLRMIAILDQSKVAWGDLAKTINSPSNQLRLLRNNFNALARTIGNIFLPVVAKVLPYVNGLVIAIRRLFEWTASMLGIDLKDVIGNSGGGYSDAFDNLGDDADNASSSIDKVADSTDKATDAQKKLNKQLQGFDKLNNMTTSTTKGSSPSDKGNGSGGDPIDLTSQLNSALADYEKVWNDEYKKMTNDAEKFADKLTKLFKNAWTSGDGSDIGSAVAKWLNKGIDWVNTNWSVADEKVQKIANILATAVNGFTYEFNWSGLGTALSSTLQTYLNGKTTFFDNTDWKALGEGVATSLNSFIGNGENGPIQSYLTNLGSELKAAIEFAFGTIKTFDFSGLGKALGDGINKFFDKMGETNPDTQKTGWEELATDISESIKGIATTITTALGTVKWEDVGQAIADFIKNMDVAGITWDLGKLVSSMATAFYKLVSNKETWNDLGTKLKEGLNSFFKAMNVKNDDGLTGWQSLGKGISDTLSGIATSLTTALDNDELWTNVGQGIADFLSSIKWMQLTWNFVKLALAVIDGIGKSITKQVKSGHPVTAAITLMISRWVLKSGWKKILSTFLGKKIAKSGLGITIGKVSAKVKKWALGKIGITDLKKVISTKIKSVSVTVKKVSVAIKEWKIAKQAGESVSLAVKIKDALGITGKTLSIGNITTKLSLKVPSFVFPDPTSDEIVRNLDEAFTSWYKTLPGYDETLGVYNFPKQLLIDFPIAIGNFIFKSNDEDNGKSKLQKAFEAFMTGGKGGTPSIKALVNYLTNTDKVKSTNEKISKMKKKITVTYGARKEEKWKKHIKAYNNMVSKDIKAKMHVVEDWEKARKLLNCGILSKKGRKDTIKRTIEISMKLSGWKGPDASTNKAIIDILSGGKKAKGGIFAGGSWHNFAQYSGGGLPGMGQMFIAREAGPELVGTIGGRTAVMNNNQIVASVSDGVFNALNPVLTYLCNSINAMNGRMDNMGYGMSVEKYTAGDLLKVVRKENSNYRRRTGKGAFD